MAGREFDGVRKLKGHFRERGLEEVFEELWTTGGKEELREESGNGYEGAKSLFQVLSGIPGSGWNKKCIEKLLKEMREEISGGKVYLTTDIYIVLGRKAV